MEKRNSDRFIGTWVPEPMYNEMVKLVPGTYVNRTELVLKAIRKLLIETHGVKF